MPNTENLGPCANECGEDATGQDPFSVADRMICDSCDTEYAEVWED